MNLFQELLNQEATGQLSAYSQDICRNGLSDGNAIFGEHLIGLIQRRNGSRSHVVALVIILVARIAVRMFGVFIRPCSKRGYRCKDVTTKY